MVEIISVRFKNGGKQYYFNPDGQQFLAGDGVIVETSRGTEYAQCVQGNSMIDEIELIAPLRPVIRKATEEDEKTVVKNKEKEEKAFSVCQEKIAEHGLDMKLVDAEYSFEGNKVLFFFTSDGRVDFRALVKDLAGAIHARIELRQIGVRDEAKMLGGLGICGKPFCCAQFLDEFQPVSIKMAKTQNLSLNPTKISGTCGRLMCCLKYEQDAYEDLVKHAPKLESFVETPDGAGTVSSINLLRQTVQVRLESAPEAPKSYHNNELCIIRNGKGKRPEGYVEPPLETLAKLRRQPEEEPPMFVGQAAGPAAPAAIVFQGEPIPPQSAEETEQQEAEGQRSSRSRRNRGRGRRSRGEGESAREIRQEQPREDDPSRQEKRRPNPPKAAQTGEQGAAGQGDGEKKSPRRRRRRPRGNGEGRTAAAQE